MNLDWKRVFLTDEAQARLKAEEGGKEGQPSTASPASGSPATSIIGTASAMAEVAMETGHDPELVESIITSISGSVPDFQRLLAKAEVIKGTVSDVRQRMEIVMKLEQVTPSQAASIVAGLNQALQNTRAQVQGELDDFKRNSIDKPNQKVSQNEASVRSLSEQIAQLQAETAALTQSVAEAQQHHKAKSQQVESSLEQVKAWLSSTAGLLGTQQP